MLYIYGDQLFFIAVITGWGWFCRARHQRDIRNVIGIGSGLARSTRMIKNNGILGIFGEINGFLVLCCIISLTYSRSIGGDYSLAYGGTGGAWYYLVCIYIATYLINCIGNSYYKYSLEWLEGSSLILPLSLIFSFYIFINNIFILLFILECQGLLLLQLLAVGAHGSTRLNSARLGIILIQYWLNFFVAILLTCSIFYWSYLSGVGIYNNIYLMVSMGGIPAGLTFTLVVTVGLKLGLAPFYYWKPELYKHLPLWLVIWYMTLYTFSAIIFLNYFAVCILHIHILLPKVSFSCSCIILMFFTLTIMWQLSEIREFLAYISVFHSLNMLVLWVIGWRSLGIIVHYISIYSFLLSGLLAVLVAYRGYNIRFWADIGKLSGVAGSFTLVILIVSIAGIPPFPGFWLKLSVISALWLNGLRGIAICILILGTVLLYYYLQNYRFYTRLQSFNQLFSVVNGDNLWCYIINCLIFSFIYAFFCVDILNIATYAAHVSLIW